MPVPRLDITLRDTRRRIDYLANFRSDSRDLAPRYQYFIAELIMLRLFAMMENAIADVAYKLVAGAVYINGNKPRRLFSASSIAGARTAMLTYGRSKPRQNLSWTKYKYIKESTSTVLESTEIYLTYAQVHGGTLDELRKVRNFIAHRNSTSRIGYKQVVLATYGANSKIDVGPFLVSEQRSSPAKIDSYLLTVKIIIADLANGY